MIVANGRVGTSTAHDCPFLGRGDRHCMPVRMVLSQVAASSVISRDLANRAMIATAFRILHYKSILDSGVCLLSGDRITVLAGQNEAGKSSVLTALRDFDLAPGAAPETADYEPDALESGDRPLVSVKFKVGGIDELADDLTNQDVAVPTAALAWLRAQEVVWISRDLRAGRYSLPWPAEVLRLFPADDPAPPRRDEAGQAATTSRHGKLGPGHDRARGRR